MDNVLIISLAFLERFSSLELSLWYFLKFHVPLQSFITLMLWKQ
jgi:hypothetical protein